MNNVFAASDCASSAQHRSPHIGKQSLIILRAALISIRSNRHHFHFAATSSAACACMCLYVRACVCVTVCVFYQDEEAVGGKFLVSRDGWKHRENQTSKHQDEPTRKRNRSGIANKCSLISQHQHFGLFALTKFKPVKTLLNTIKLIKV